MTELKVRQGEWVKITWDDETNFPITHVIRPTEIGDAFVALANEPKLRKLLDEAQDSVKKLQEVVLGLNRELEAARGLGGNNTHTLGYLLERVEKLEDDFREFHHGGTTVVNNAPAKWLPIETAPKDGRSFVTYNLRGGEAVSKWSAGWDKWIHVGGASVQPTHWLPLPEPPAGLGKGVEHD